jgi:hypothetical protein
MPTWELNPGHPHYRHTCYQLSYDSKQEEDLFYGTYEETVMKVENTIVYYKEMVVSTPNTAFARV